MSAEWGFFIKSSNDDSVKFLLVHLATLLAIPMTSFSSKGAENCRL